MTSQATKSSITSVLWLGILFFIFGFVTWLNGTLIQYLKIACELTKEESYLVTFAFYISYFVMALPSAGILKVTGFKKGMMLGLVVMAIGALLFIPAANSRAYPVFLAGLFVIGTGLSILQTASNPYITIVGPIESAAQRISIMGICNKLAGILAPIVLGMVVLADADSFTSSLSQLSETDKLLKLNELATRVITPYSIMAVVLFLLSVMLWFSPLPEIEQEEELTDEADNNKPIFAYPNLILGVIALFLYVGVEVVAGDTIGPYGLSQGLPLSETKNFTAFTLAAMLVGYVLGIVAIPKIVSQDKALTISAIVGILFTLGIVFTKGYLSVMFIALLGLANALMWPAIWPLAIHGLGKHTKTGSALLIMAIAGGALLPLAYARIASLSGIGDQAAYWVMVPCYAFILFYSVKGFKIKW